MTEKEMRKLSRADLLELLIDQSAELQKVRAKLSETEEALKQKDEELKQKEEALEQKEIMINTAGSIAEASLQLNGVFEAAQAASKQYMDNIKLLSERQESICREIDRESREKAALRISQAEKASFALESETKSRCAKMVAEAKGQSQAYWDELSVKLDRFCEEHAGIRELLSILPLKQE